MNATRQFRRMITGSVSLMGLAGAACAEIVTWDGGGGDSLWTNALNWSTDAVPLSTDDVFIDASLYAATSLNIDLDGGRTINSMTFEGTKTLNFNDGTLTITSGQLYRLNGAGGVNNYMSAQFAMGSDSTLFNQSGSGGSWENWHQLDVGGHALSIVGDFQINRNNGKVTNVSGITVKAGSFTVSNWPNGQSLANRIPDTTPINLDAGNFIYEGGTGNLGVNPETVGAMTFAGGQTATVHARGGSDATFTVASLTREPGAALNVILYEQPAAKFIVASGAPSRLTLNATTVNMLAPYYTAGSGTSTSFADYVPGSGFTNATFTSTIAANATWSDTSETSIVDLLGKATLGADNKVAAVRMGMVNGSLEKGVYTSIEVGSGGIIGPLINVIYNVKPRLIFGPGGTGEAIFYPYTGGLEVSGGVTANGFTKNGAGYLNLSGDQSATLLGTFTLNTGILRLLGSAKLAPSSPVVVNGGTLYLWDGSQQTVASLTLRSGSLLQGGNTSPVKMTANSFTLESGTVGVNLAGVTGTLTKNSSGKPAIADVVTLSGASTYAGTTTVNGGTLAVTGSIASTNWILASGATLSFTGATTLAGKTLTLDAGGTASGLLSVTGDLTLGGELILSGLAGERKIATSTTSISGAFARSRGGITELRNGGTELWAYPAPRATEIVIR